MEKALGQAQANANRDGEPRHVLLWARTYWIGRTPVPASREVRPMEPARPVEKDDSQTKAQRKPVTPMPESGSQEGSLGHGRSWHGGLYGPYGEETPG